MKAMISRLVLKIKRWFRKKQLFYKYNHNYESEKLIVVTDDDRCLGLTLMMMEDCLLRGYRLYVRNMRTKENFAKDMYKYCQLGLFPQCPSVSASVAFNNYLLCPEDLKNVKYKGFATTEVIVDNSCTVFEVNELFGLEPYGVKIINGFIYVPLAKC